MDDQSRAIEHLAEAIYLFACIRDTGDTPTVPVQIGKHQITVTPKTAEALADIIDSTITRSAVGQTATAAPVREQCGAGEWSAAAVAQNEPDLYADITNLFDEISPETYLDDVFGSPDPEKALAAYEQMVTGEWDGEL
jgi:hypothetical protein